MQRWRQKPPRFHTIKVEIRSIDLLLSAFKRNLFFEQTNSAGLAKASYMCTRQQHRAGSAPQGTRGRLRWVGTHLMCRKLERNRFLWGSGLGGVANDLKGQAAVPEAWEVGRWLTRKAEPPPPHQHRRIICTATSTRGVVKGGAIKRGQTEATLTVGLGK